MTSVIIYRKYFEFTTIFQHINSREHNITHRRTGGTLQYSVFFCHIHIAKHPPIQVQKKNTFLLHFDSLRQQRSIQLVHLRRAKCLFISFQLETLSFSYVHKQFLLFSSFFYGFSIYSRISKCQKGMLSLFHSLKQREIKKQYLYD